MWRIVKRELVVNRKKEKKKRLLVRPKNSGDLTQVCSAETNPFIVAFTATPGLEQVSNACKPELKQIFRTISNEL